MGVFSHQYEVWLCCLQNIFRNSLSPSLFYSYMVIYLSEINNKEKMRLLNEWLKTKRVVSRTFHWELNFLSRNSFVVLTKVKFLMKIATEINSKNYCCWSCQQQRTVDQLVCIPTKICSSTCHRIPFIKSWNVRQQHWQNHNFDSSTGFPFAICRGIWRDCLEWERTLQLTLHLVSYACPSNWTY